MLSFIFIFSFFFICHLHFHHLFIFISGLIDSLHRDLWKIWALAATIATCTSRAPGARYLFLQLWNDWRCFQPHFELLISSSFIIPLHLSKNCAINSGKSRILFPLVCFLFLMLYFFTPFLSFLKKIYYFHFFNFHCSNILVF